MKASNGSKKRLLIAVENTVERVGLSIILQREGYEIIPAENSGQAADCLRGQAPDLLLLDAPLPGNGGERLLTELRQANGSAVPVIALVRDDDPARGGVSELPAAAVVTKPIATGELRDKVRQHCR